MKDKRQLVLDISRELKLSHIGSNLAELPVLEEIYAIKKPTDIVVLDNAHAHLVHLVMEHGEKAKEYIGHDIHCNLESGCIVAGGSLGLAGAVSLGLAMANRDRDVYVTYSDAGTNEGIFWECLQIAYDQRVMNWKPYIVCNSYGAYRDIDTQILEGRIAGFGFPVAIRKVSSDFEGITGINAHYATL